MGFPNVSNEPTSKDLFEFIKSIFEQQKHVHLDIEFERGYIASLDGTMPIRADEASRLFSSRKEIYVDELILAALFEYVATYYLWARDYEDDNVFAFCFKYTLFLLNYTNRLGILTDDDRKAQLVAQIVTRYNENGINLIADLYWSCLAFAFCHEIAHIYLKHLENKQNDPWKDEFEADAVGYEIYLQIIEMAKEDVNIPFSGVFHDYLYIAPNILFQFYSDTYFMSYWLFGEKAGNSHPPLEDRSRRLLEICQQPQFTFETKEGNILLNNYLDVSDWFREQLIIKLQKGKIDILVQEGFAFMLKPGYDEAIQFQKNKCNDLLEKIKKYGFDNNQVIGLWDTAVDIELLNEPSSTSFVWSYRGKTYSTKAFNVRFCLNKVLKSVLEFGGSFSVPDSKVKTVFTALLILDSLLEISTLELCDDHAKMLIKCHDLQLDIHTISEDELLRVTGMTNTVITDLCKLGCIELSEGMIRLKENIFIC